MFHLLTTAIIASSAAAAPVSRGWPAITVPPEAAALYRALAKRTLDDVDAASVFLALVPPGRYEVRTGNLTSVLVLDVERVGKNQVLLSASMIVDQMHVGREFTLQKTSLGKPGSVRLSLRAWTLEGHPILRLQLAPTDEDASAIRLTFSRGLKSFADVSFDGPLLARFKDLAPKHITGPNVRFKFTGQEPSTGLELDCRKLLRRLDERESS